MTEPEGAPPRAKLVGGVWLPDNDDHFADWMFGDERERSAAVSKYRALLEKKRP